MLFDPQGLIDFIARGHDDEQVHIAILVSFPTRVRTEENDLFRMEFAGNLFCQAGNHPCRCGKAGSRPT